VHAQRIVELLESPYKATTLLAGKHSDTLATTTSTANIDERRPSAQSSATVTQFGYSLISVIALFLFTCAFLGVGFGFRLWPTQAGRLLCSPSSLLVSNLVATSSGDPRDGSHTLNCESSASSNFKTIVSIERWSRMHLRLSSLH
jgi:hypothetical protein